MNREYQFLDSAVHQVSENHFPRELEERLIGFAVSIIKISNKLPKTRAGNHIGGQLVRSGTAPALIYGEAQYAESRKDFIHKMKIALKELRETMVSLKIIHKASLLNTNEIIDSLIPENDELISIFVKSVLTAQKNLNKDE